MVISRPERQRLQLEIACPSLDDSRKLIEEFGGVIEKWPRDWLRRFEERRRSKPLKIGKRLLILRAPKEEEAGGFPDSLAIPASAAFGTGEHATTAMSLRLLERLTHKWKNGWSLADLGTGTGILALAAKRLGARNVIGVDIDLKAISIAKANARLNKINNVAFRLRDLRKWKQSGRTDIVAANLYSELLIEILPNLKRSNWLILSGVLRTQEDKLFRVLRRNNIQIMNVKRRGKWIAVLASPSDD